MASPDEAGHQARRTRLRSAALAELDGEVLAGVQCLPPVFRVRLARRRLLRSAPPQPRRPRFPRWRQPGGWLSASGSVRLDAPNELAIKLLARLAGVGGGLGLYPGLPGPL